MSLHVTDSVIITNPVTGNPTSPYVPVASGPAVLTNSPIAIIHEGEDTDVIRFDDGSVMESFDGNTSISLGDGDFIQLIAPGSMLLMNSSGASIVNNNILYLEGDDVQIGTQNATTISIGNTFGSTTTLFGPCVIDSLVGGQVLFLDGGKNLAQNGVSNIELGYLSGASGPLQGQINAILSEFPINLQTKVTNVLPYANGGTGSNDPVTAIGGLLSIVQLVNQIKINDGTDDYYIPCSAANTPLT